MGLRKLIVAQKHWIWSPLWLNNSNLKIGCILLTLYSMLAWNSATVLWWPSVSLLWDLGSWLLHRNIGFDLLYGSILKVLTLYSTLARNSATVLWWLSVSLLWDLGSWLLHKNIGFDLLYGSIFFIIFYGGFNLVNWHCFLDNFLKNRPWFFFGKSDISEG